MKFAAALALLAGILFCAAGVRPLAAQIPSGRDVVSPSAVTSLDPVGRGRPFQIAVVLKIRDGFHINAREKSAEYLIATDLSSRNAAGFKIGEVTYPKGALHTFSFSKTPLNVYEGTVILRMGASALPDAPPGAQHISLKLRYQACSVEVCLPPVTLDVDVPVTIATAASASRPAHAELFRSHQ